MHYIFAHPDIVAKALGQHIWLSFAALAVALAFAIPVGVLAARSKFARTPIFALLGAIYTIPSLALFALLIPVLGLGFTTALVALAAYAQMILVRNIAAGIDGVDPAAREAARGMGMDGWQVFWRVERPLAMPVALGGVRIAAVSIIGIANVAAWIDAGGLGTLVLGGIQADYPDKAVAGALVSAALALTVDFLLRRAEARYRRHLVAPS
ncbi:MAG TPA: ABC transporter permease [Candidatus Eremiobacteraceae bacterium]|nr:ABC transporter permease [Candidatus Eremiobacteraceae bacterium]